VTPEGVVDAERLEALARSLSDAQVVRHWLDTVSPKRREAATALRQYARVVRSLGWLLSLSPYVVRDERGGHFEDGREWAAFGVDETLPAGEAAVGYGPTPLGALLALAERVGS
jgi:hypothetical protein